MSKYRFGKRIGKEGTLRVSASALIYDEGRERILMTYRLNRYPDVYSTSRLARAYHVISSSM